MAVHYRWVLDFGEGSDAKRYKTSKMAANAGLRPLIARKIWAQKFAHDTVQDIADAIEKVKGTPDEGRAVRVCVDKHTGFHMEVRITREVIPEAEWEQMQAARTEKAKDKRSPR